MADGLVFGSGGYSLAFADEELGLAWFEGQVAEAAGCAPSGARPHPSLTVVLDGDGQHGGAPCAGTVSSSAGDGIAVDSCVDHGDEFGVR